MLESVYPSYCVWLVPVLAGRAGNDVSCNELVNLRWSHGGPMMIQILPVTSFVPKCLMSDGKWMEHTLQGTCNVPDVREVRQITQYPSRLTCHPRRVRET
jgi:hypothetical protein